MKKFYILLLGFLAISLIFAFSPEAKAIIKTVYQSNDPITIKTKLGTQTVMIFSTQIEFVSVGNPQLFNVQTDPKQDKLIINAMKVGVWTNLIVITKDSKQYVFMLTEDKGDLYYDLVTVKPRESIPYDQIVKVLQEKKTAIDQSIFDFINTYELKTPYRVQNSLLKVDVKKAAIIENTDETVYWFRLTNTSNHSYSINAIGVKERDLRAVITENNLDTITPGISIDYYLIAAGRGLDSDLTLNLNIEGEIYEILLAAIPFPSSSYRVYEVTGANR